MRRGALLALMLVALTSGCLAGPLTGEPVPAFDVVTSDGQRVDETTYLGQFVVLDLMATWCGPCKLEVAHLREVQARHPDAVILSIGVDPQETLVEHEAFREKYGATWPYAIDRNGSIKADMGMRIIPKLVVVDPEGIVVFEREGEVLPAAITRAIDPSSAPPAGATLLASLAALVAGAFAPLNPYRCAHRETGTAGPTLAALGALAALAVLLWPFAGLASTRATYGSLFVGALTLVGAAWWWIRRRGQAQGQGQGQAQAQGQGQGQAQAQRQAQRQAQAQGQGRAQAQGQGQAQAQGGAVQAAGDRAYELAPHFAAAVVLALGSAGVGGFFAPLAAFFLGAAGGFWVRARLTDAQREIAGLVGLVLVGGGLVLFGARILLV